MGDELKQDAPKEVPSQNLALTINFRNQQQFLIQKESDIVLLNEIHQKLDLLSRDHFDHYAKILSEAEL